MLLNKTAKLVKSPVLLFDNQRTKNRKWILLKQKTPNGLLRTGFFFNTLKF